MIELSFAQQGLWLLDRVLPDRTVYNVPYAFRLAGRLQVDALRRALDEVVRRHDVLRARFVLVDGVPMQDFAPEPAVDLEVEDLGAFPEDERETRALQRARAEARQPFDLERGPLLRARLLRLDEADHWLLLTLHHIVTDGWSMQVLARELSALYDAHCHGEASPLPGLPIQYGDYAAWQREWLRGPVFDAQLDHWKRALAGMSGAELPLDRPRPAIATHRGGRVVLEVRGALTGALKAMSRQAGASLFTTLLAAFHVLLFRYTGHEDVAVGVPAAARRRPELERLIGFFVNTLVLRGDLSGNPRFDEYLAQVRGRVLDALSHQDLPFEGLVEALAPKRDMARNPLFQVMLVFQNAPAGEWRMPGIEVRPIDGIDTGTAKFDLALALSEQAGGLVGHLEYATDLFDRTTIERLAGHWQVLLEGIVADPRCRVAQLPLLDPPERQRLLVEWNDTAVDYPRDRCIHELFERQVQRSPVAPAVLCEERQLTYRALNARANRLAHRLRAWGVGPEVRVALCAQRSPELIVALLAILKAGGAYVPLDPEHPASRLEFLLEDAQPAVLLTQQHLRDRIPARSCTTFCLDADWASLAAQPDTDPACVTTPANLAYVMYTSGSTGQPKGVLVEHRSVCNHLVAQPERYRPDATDCMLQTAAIDFDPSVLQIFVPLMVGARVALPPPGAQRSPEAIVELIRRHGVTLLRMVPSLLAAIVDGPGLSACTRLRRVFCGGEALGGALAARFSAQCGAELVQTYGPTETTVHSIWFPYRPSDGTSAIPIGRPIANTRAYVLDAYGQPVPIGVAGELCIGGDGVTRGYLGQPEATARRFVADAFARDPAARMYKTGDRARFLPDGNLEFLGRLDRQVKLRGVRVEPGEVEAVLMRHGDVREAVVVAREDAPGDTRLVAYIVARDGGVSTAGLRTWTRQMLPESMLPAAFVVLPALPRSPNGKVDPDALPAPGYQGDEIRYRPPGTPIEQTLTEMMAALLKAARVGTHDDFFDLGGHSLMAVQMTSRIRKAFNVELSAVQLFRTPTVHGLARVVQDLLASR